FDEVGVGGPVGDRIRQLGYQVFGFKASERSPNPKYLNMRAYSWAKMKEWFINGGAIDSNETLETDLTSVEYRHDKKDRLLLESKEEMKKRGLASPDHGDALSMTFAFPFLPVSGPGGTQGKMLIDWKPES